jgi:hypothetical protein
MEAKGVDVKTELTAEELQEHQAYKSYPRKSKECVTPIPKSASNSSRS